jgi:hypothetical protein
MAGDNNPRISGAILGELASQKEKFSKKLISMEKQIE